MPTPLPSIKLESAQSKVNFDWRREHSYGAMQVGTSAHSTIDLECTMPKQTKHSLAARTRVLDAHREGTDWVLVAFHNGISRTTAHRIVERGSPEVSKRGGAREAHIKCTPEIEEALVEYVEDNCLLTLEQMKEMIWFDLDVDLSTSSISQKLVGKLYSLNQHMREGAFIVYYDETNYNLYCKRAPIGQREAVNLPPSNGRNLQIQGAVATEAGLLHYETQRGSIQMDANAAFGDAVYDAAKEHDTYKEYFSGKTVVIVLDNAPAHGQTKGMVRGREDLVLLRLTPYSPMCNPIEGCFSVLKVAIKRFLSMNQERMTGTQRGQMKETQMQLLEQAAESYMKCMDLRLVNKIVLHCAHVVVAATRSEPMEYGT